MALSLLETSSSRYWYLSFFLARHSRALWRLRSSFAFRSIFAGLRPRFPGFFTFPPTIWEEQIFDHLLIKNPSIFLEGRLYNRLRWDGLAILGPMWNGLLNTRHKSPSFAGRTEANRRLAKLAEVMQYKKGRNKDHLSCVYEVWLNHPANAQPKLFVKTRKWF